MSTTPGLREALAEFLDASQIITDSAMLERTGHDTWPVSTKLDMVGNHDLQGEILVKAMTIENLQIVLAIAQQYDTPVTVRALASSVTGQPLPTQGGIVLDVTGLPTEYCVNERDMIVEVSASYNGGFLEDELNKQGYTLGHSPQSLYRSTVGGWLSTLATGQFSSYYGGIEDLVVGYTAILATGEEITLQAKPRAAMGPDLRQVFLGSEGTLAIITRVSLKLFPLPETRILEAFAMPDVTAGIEALRAITVRGLRPFLVRFYDIDEARHAMVDSGVTAPVMFLGTQGTAAIAKTEMAELTAIMSGIGATSLGSNAVDAWMGRRFDFSTVEKILATKGGYAETIEVAHYWSGIEDLYADLKNALAPLATEVLVHFSHVYTQGTSMYVILLGQTDTDEKAVEILRQIWATTMTICVEHGAELSHHHGGGIARSPYARRSLGSAHKVLRRIKSALDPNGILNPGKLGL